MKAFTFELFHGNKKLGDRNTPARIIVIKNAADKNEARRIAERNAPNLQIVNGGKSFANEKGAVADAAARCALYNRTKKGEAEDCAWYAADVQMQRGIANLLGI